MRILLAEDDPLLADAVTRALTQSAHVVDLAQTGTDADSSLRANDYGLAILDVQLPGMDGFEVLRRLRDRGMKVPVLILTVRDDVDDRVRGLDLGADDYLTKPFGIDELLARLRAALRRAAPADAALVVTTQDFTVDLGRKAVTASSGDEVHLTPTEWSILEMLVRADGMLVTGPDLLREVWGPQYEQQSNYLRVYLAQLRRKLEPDPAHPRYLLTAPGLGYRFERHPG